MNVISALAVVSSIAPSYELYSVCFARVESAPARAFIVDPELPKRIPVTFAIHVIQGADRTVLIDTGFERHQVAAGWKLTEHQSIVELLRKIDVQTDDVTDVILTHAHWDHWQGLGHFPRASIWLSKRMASGAPPRLASMLRKRSKQVQRIGVDGSDIAPGIRAVPVGLHTPGFQYVEVRVDGKLWIFSSDLAPLYRNFDRLRPTGQTASARRTLKWMATILERVDGDAQRIIPSHDPQLCRGQTTFQHKLLRRERE